MPWLRYKVFFNVFLCIDDSSEVGSINHLYSDLVESDTNERPMFDSGQFLEYICILLALVLMLCAVVTLFLYCVRKRQKLEMSRHQKTVKERMRREQLYNEELANILRGSDSDNGNGNGNAVHSEVREQRLKQFIDKAFDEYESEAHFITPTPSLIAKRGQKETMAFSMLKLRNDDEIVTKGGEVSQKEMICENEFDIVTPGGNELTSKNSMSLLSMISEDSVSML